ncbi:GntR family transcriptional regulator [Devosia sp. ZB163]|uniref:GntR family transcriptional regulator n=1 Tax=Devosia sp. ZB163 TaxID=3025938 RepID=UPI0023611495|nr:GntR family transcriptional regulator [Devosia sp. ZB163]MDC9825161.1 GntR family transcriptional regulator [Devosia sp. ZB163]
MTAGGRVTEDLSWLDLINKESVVLTKSQLARRHIQKMILSGEIRPGDRLTTREVSQALGISETPCREAVNSLAAEGWLEVQSHVGAVVQGLRIDQIKEISALRGLICELAIELNASRYDADFLGRLDENIERSFAALEINDFGTFGALNYQFHKMLCDGPGSPYSYRILENMLGLMSSRRHGIPAYRERLEEAIQEHCQIRDRLKSGDFEGAARIARQHELNTGKFLIRKMAELEEAKAGTSP